MGHTAQRWRRLVKSLFKLVLFLIFIPFTLPLLEGGEYFYRICKGYLMKSIRSSCVLFLLTISPALHAHQEDRDAQQESYQKTFTTYLKEAAPIVSTAMLGALLSYVFLYHLRPRRTTTASESSVITATVSFSLSLSEQARDYLHFWLTRSAPEPVPQGLDNLLRNMPGCSMARDGI
jgi:hypothetical protein